MNREIIPKLKIIIGEAVKEAREMGDDQVKPEHLIISIISDNNNGCVDALKNLGINLNELNDNLYLSLNNTNLTPKIQKGTKVSIPFNKESRKLFNSVDHESENMGDNHIDSTHIMMAILNSNNNITIKKLLNQVCNVTYEKFVKTVKNMRDMLDQVKNSSEDDDFDYSGPNEDKKDKKPKRNTPSKTPVLDNFCSDITKLVDENKIDPVIGRSKEIKRVVQILSRRKKNNPVLIGEAGVGKSSIAEGIALLIKSGNAPRTLIDKKIYSLDLASVVAGTKYRGQFEERIKAILDELKANSDIILFIDELHTFIGAGNASGSLDASNIFKPALARGEIQVIGATTLNEFRQHIEKDGALTRRFQQVLVEATTTEETKMILNNIKEKYEKYHSVSYTDEAIEECVKMADRYITDRAMPDKAIDVLDEAGASTNTSHELPENIKKLELKKEDILKRKLEVVQKQKYEEAAELRDGERKINEELDKAKKVWLESLDKKKTTVDVDLIAETVSMMTGIPLSKISSQENKRLMAMDKTLMGKVIGQDDAVLKVIKAIKRNRLGIRNRNKPIGSFIFLGPTGVGKTYLTKLLTDEIFGDSESLIRVDMSEFMEKHSVSKLIGSPPGYVGFEQGGQLTEKIRRKPYSVILFDEIEKAHEDVFNILLQVLDEGCLTDSFGRKINFKNSLIILTSNVGARELSSFGKSMGFQTDAVIANEEGRTRSIIEKALKNKFKPEFLNRIDEIIVFNSLKEEDIHKIIYNELDKLKERVKEMGYDMKIQKSAIEFVAKNGYDEAYGARPLNRAIQRYIEDPIADEILSGNIKEGETINITFDKTKNEIVLKSEKIK
jgi:ATP-dependent Clp protease ATP-binding subunit ClpC